MTVVRRLATPATALLVSAAAAGPATAAAPSTVTAGTTAVRPAGTSFRALDRAGVRVLPLGDAVRRGPRIELAATGGRVGAVAAVEHHASDGLALVRGARTVRLSDLQLRIGRGSARVTGRIDGGARHAVLRIARRAFTVAPGGRAATTRPSTWTLTGRAAAALRRRLAVPDLRAGGFAVASVGLHLVPPGTGAPTVPTPIPVPAPAPPAPDRPAGTVLGGAADWGLRASFRSYIEHGIAHGRIETSGGATRNPDGTIRFGTASGTVDPASGAVDVRFGGTVYAEGHGAGEAAALRLWITNPRIVAAAGATEGEIRGDVRSKSLDTNEVVAYPDVAFARLDLTRGQRTSAGGVVTWTGVPATLTEPGVPAFAGFYPAGSELDPVSFSVTTTTP
jgi:hypothetical protein